MAEIGGKGVSAGKLGLNIQKTFSRAQEKVMQKLGKADETRDMAFEELVANFNKQMTEGTKLQKDLKAYLTAVKTMHDASRRLQDCLADMYEPDWFGKEEIDSMAEEMIEKEMDYNLEETDVLWTDYHDKVQEDSVISLDTYLTQFNDIKARIAKRERKMTDFDSARHHFASVQKGKKKDEAKIAKPTALLEMAAPSWAQGLISAHQVAQNNLTRNQAEEELGRAQKVFEELNVELQDELPALYDSRVGLYVHTFQSMAGCQEKFHKEMGKLSQDLNDIMTKLEEQKDANEAANHSESADSPPKRPTQRPGPPPNRPPPRPTSAPNQDEDDLSGDEASYTQPAPPRAAQAPSWDSWEPEQPPSSSAGQDDDEDQYRYPEEAQQEEGGWDDEPPQQAGGGGGGGGGSGGWDDGDTAPPPPGEPEEAWNDGADGTASYAQPSWDDEEVVTNGSDGELPPGFIYKVKAVHDYGATDGDELELKAGDVVLVMAFDTPDEQDDGWLMGVKESHWLEHKDLSIKGVFPENFTQKF